MPGYVSAKTGGDFKILAPGTYAAVCDQVVFLGKQETAYGIKEQVWLRWQVPSERLEWEKNGEPKEGPMVIGAIVGANIHEKATLGKWLAAWRGRPFTDEEKKRFDLFNVLGNGCLLTVVHNDSKGKTYANVSAVANLVKGMEVPKVEGDVIRYSADEPQMFDRLPEWLRNKVSAQVKEEPAVWAGRPDPDTPADPNDDIPFN